MIGRGSGEKQILRKPIGWLTAFVALIAAVGTAYAMSVQPIVLDLLAGGRRTSALIRVENDQPDPTTVEVRVFEAEYTETGIRTTDRLSDDLVVFPPQSLIAPGRTQTVRVQYVGEPNLARSRHYIVSIAQLPVRLPEGQSAVQLLYNFNAVVGVGIPGVRPALSITRSEVMTGEDGQPHAALIVENTSTTYGYFAGGSLRLIQRDAAGREVFRRSMTSQEINQEFGLGLVGPGQTRRIITPFTLPQPGGTVEASFTPAR